MHLCYIDEAGCTGELPDPESAVQPVFVLAGLMLPERCIRPLTVEWINLKQRHFPNLLGGWASPRFHDWMAAELKGSTLRKMIRSGRNQRRFAGRVLEDVLRLFDRHHVRIAGRVFAKPIGGKFSGVHVYTSTAQSICTTFQHYLQQHDSQGVVIADSRNPAANTTVSHSIFTQRHRAGGDPYPRIIEAPTFGHSDNHAGLQLADVLCSALLFPIATQVCSSEHLLNQMHCGPMYFSLRTMFGARMRAMQWQHPSAEGVSGGITLKDQLGGKKTPSLFVDSVVSVGGLQSAYTAAVGASVRRPP